MEELISVHAITYHNELNGIDYRTLCSNCVIEDEHVHGVFVGLVSSVNTGHIFL